MHNYKYILHFRVEPAPLDQENAIMTGAAREIAIQRAQSKNTENTLLQSVVNPIQSRGRGTGRARGSRGLGSRVTRETGTGRGG